MGRGTWPATGHGVTRVGHDLVTQQGQIVYWRDFHGRCWPCMWYSYLWFLDLSLHMRCLLLCQCEKLTVISMKERILGVITISVLSPSLKSQSITPGIQWLCLTLRNCNEKNHRTGECWHHAKGRAPPGACSSRVDVIHSAPFLPPLPLESPREEKQAWQRQDSLSTGGTLTEQNDKGCNTFSLLGKWGLLGCCINVSLKDTDSTNDLGGASSEAGEWQWKSPHQN